MFTLILIIIILAIALATCCSMYNSERKENIEKTKNANELYDKYYKSTQEVTTIRKHYEKLLDKEKEQTEIARIHYRDATRTIEQLQKDITEENLKKTHLQNPEKTCIESPKEHSDEIQNTSTSKTITTTPEKQNELIYDWIKVYYLEKDNEKLGKKIENKNRTIKELRNEIRKNKNTILKFTPNLSMEYRFKIAGYNKWEANIHYTPKQYQKIQKVNQEKITVLRYLEDKKKWDVKGNRVEPYQTSLKECNCRDYETRRLPCKHMYALVIYLSDKKIQESQNINLSPKERK